MNKNKKDYLIISLGFQILICAIIFGGCFGLKSTNSDIISTLKDEYFDKLNENFIVTELEEVNESQKTAKNKSEETTAVTETKIPTKETTVDSTLSAEIKAEGGADVSIDSVYEIPANVSVNGYTLNQKMI